ncbi:hypothetical protein, partial [Pseudomonas aeruginosa]|uniref:hypothetical protein n=1 Tax=Pseudomonas aeruginosa TaxID=287 RepID=UPI002E807E87
AFPDLEPGERGGELRAQRRRDLSGLVMTSAVVTLCSVLVLVFVVSWWSSRADDFQREPAAETQPAERGAPPDEGESPEDPHGESDKNEP